MAQLDAVPLQPEPFDDRGERLDVAGTHGRAQLLELGRVLPELLGHLGEGVRLLQRVLDRHHREDAAELEADEHAAPAAEEEADVVAVREETRALEHLAKPLGVAAVRRLDRGVERRLVLEQSAQRCAGGPELGGEIGPLAQLRVAHPAADEPVVDMADPVAEQMADRLELVLLDDALERCGVPLLDRRREPLHRLLVGRDPHERLGERARVRRARDDRRRAAEPEAEQHGVLDPEPFAHELAVPDEPEPLQDLLVGLLVSGLERRRGGKEGLLVRREATDDVRFLYQVVEDIELEFLICHDVSLRWTSARLSEGAVTGPSPARHRAYCGYLLAVFPGCRVVLRAAAGDHGRDMLGRTSLPLLGALASQCSPLSAAAAAGRTRCRQRATGALPPSE